MVDYLDEDTPINNQKFCVISYVTPGEVRSNNEGGNVMFKIRGSYATQEECNKKIESLQNVDKYFNMFVTEVGKWGCLLTPEQLKETDISVNFRNKELNNFMMDYKNQRKKADIEFEERKNKMTEQARIDGTREGQEKLQAEKENPISVKKRLQDSEEMAKDLQKQLAEVEEIRHQAYIKMGEYTEQEVMAAEKKFKNLVL